MTIVNLRGTHGSGKSTVVTKIMAKYGATWDTKHKQGYNVELPNGEVLRIVGRYETACGGCDGIQPYSDIWPAVIWGLSLCDHVLFEGVLVSTTYGSIGEASEKFGDQFVFAFMDTPLEECVRRVNARRAARGVDPITDTKNIDSKYATIARLGMKLAGTYAGTPRLVDPPHRRVAVIDYTHPVKDVLKLFGVRINKEPT